MLKLDNVINILQIIIKIVNVRYNNYLYIFPFINNNNKYNNINYLYIVYIKFITKSITKHDWLYISFFKYCINCSAEF